MDDMPEWAEDRPEDDFDAAIEHRERVMQALTNAVIEAHSLMTAKDVLKLVIDAL